MRKFHVLKNFENIEQNIRNIGVLHKINDEMLSNVAQEGYEIRVYVISLLQNENCVGEELEGVVVLGGDVVHISQVVVRPGVGNIY